MDFYFCTLSNRIIVYKGMLRSVVVGAFFEDLTDEDYESAFAIYHRRFSTNTTPKWPLAQPMRFLGHNGEINTLQVGEAACCCCCCCCYVVRLVFSHLVLQPPSALVSLTAPTVCLQPQL
jgi:hypothetical protein